MQGECWVASACFLPFLPCLSLSLSLCNKAVRTKDRIIIDDDVVNSTNTTLVNIGWQRLDVFIPDYHKFWYGTGDGNQVYPLGTMYTRWIRVHIDCLEGGLSWLRNQKTHSVCVDYSSWPVSDLSKDEDILCGSRWESQDLYEWISEWVCLCVSVSVYICLICLW